MLNRARVVLLGIIVTGRAAAQNADGILLGTEAALTGGAVLSTTHDPAGAYYNPAGLAAMSATTLQVSASAYQLSNVRLRSFVRTNLPWTSIDQTVNATDWSTLASVAAYGFRLSPRIGAALGVWVPASASISFVSAVHSAGPYTAGGTTQLVDYTQRIALTQRVERTYFGAASGFALHPAVRVGAAAFLVYDRAEEFFDLSAGAVTDAANAAQTAATATASTRGTPSQLAGRLGLGLQWDVTPALSVAVALKSPSVALVSFGDLTAITQFATLLPGATPSVGFREEQIPRSALAEPWRVAVGNAVSVGGASLRAELDWQAPRAGQHGVVNGRLGLHRPVTADFTWGAGLFTDRSPEDVHSGALSVDYYGVAAGIDYRLAQVRAARPAGASWDVRASLAVRYALGVGEVERLEANALVPSPSTPSTAQVVVHQLGLNVGGLLMF